MEAMDIKLVDTAMLSQFDESCIDCEDDKSTDDIKRRSDPTVVCEKVDISGKCVDKEEKH